MGGQVQRKDWVGNKYHPGPQHAVGVGTAPLIPPRVAKSRGGIASTIKNKLLPPLTLFEQLWGCCANYFQVVKTPLPDQLWHLLSKNFHLAHETLGLAVGPEPRSPSLPSGTRHTQNDLGVALVPPPGGHLRDRGGVLLLLVLAVRVPAGDRVGLAGLDPQQLRVAWPVFELRQGVVRCGAG